MPLYPPATILSQPQPEDIGFKAWTYDPAIYNTGTSPATGVLNSMMIWVRKPMTVSAVNFYVATAGVTLTNVGVALYNSAGALLQSTVNTGNATTTVWQATGLKTCAITSTTLSAGVYYAACWQTGTTIAALARTISGGSGMNTGTTMAAALGLRYAVANTGLTTTAPATLTQTGNGGAAYWAALS